MLRLTKSLSQCFARNARYSSTIAAGPGVPYKTTFQKGDVRGAPTSTTGPELPSHADVVILGGGVAGCSALYHLAKAGAGKVVLLERDALTAGTTWHTAGLVWHLRPSDVEVELLGYSWELMKSLEAETGVNTGYIQNGGLFIASTKERLDEYQRLGTLGKVYNVESHVLGPKESKELYPLMNVSDVYGTLYSPTDGTIDPAGYCAALTRGAQRHGGMVFQRTPVKGIEVVPADGTSSLPRVKAVLTDKGRIETPCVVNAAGCWAPKLGKMAGVKVPLCATRHAYIVSERIEGIQNMPNVRDHDASVYLRLQGDALSIGGYEPNPIFWDPQDDFAFSLFELDWDVFSVSIQGAINRVPIIEKTGVKSTVCGPESFTPDHKPLMGESPEVRGYFLSCGYNSAGMMLSGGCGRELANWVLKGRPELDMFGYDIRRFTERVTNNAKWIKERSHEAYAKNYSIVYKNDEPLGSRNMTVDVLHETLTSKGCVFQERQSFERPGWFSNHNAKVLPYDYYGNYGHEGHKENPYYEHLKLDYTFQFPKQHEQIGRECRTCRTSAALFNMSYFGKFYLVGPDAAKAADWIFSADVRRAPGQTVYTCVLNHRAGVESDLTVSVMEPDAGVGLGLAHNPKLQGPNVYYVAIGGAVSQYASSYIRDIILKKGFNCTLVDKSLDMVLLSLQGPKSREILQSLTSTDLSNSAFPFSSHRCIEVAGRPCRAIRLSFVGELGWELHVDNTHALGVYEAVMKAGEKFGICDSGYRAIDSLSIEKGYRHWHADVRSDDTPLEAGLAFTCKLKTDIDFFGRRALEEQKKKGLLKRIALFSTNEPVMLHGLEAIVRDGKVVGFLRRADYAFTVGKSLGYGYVRRPDGQPVSLDFLREGHYEIEKMGVRYPATFHAKSLFDPDNKRVQGIYQ